MNRLEAKGEVQMEAFIGDLIFRTGAAPASKGPTPVVPGLPSLPVA